MLSRRIIGPRWAVAFSLALVLGTLDGNHRAVADAGTPLASVQAEPGWLTMGQVVPPGVATDGLRIGNLPTQTDVKKRWRDGSIQFAVITAHVPEAGNYPIAAASTPAGAFEPRVPTASVSLAKVMPYDWDRAIYAPGVAHDYTVTLPAQPCDDYWLHGSEVVEWRCEETPGDDDGSHPYLRFMFDVRVYRDGQARLDIAAENTLNKIGAGPVRYSVTISAEGQELFRHDAFTHFYLTRWRQVLPINGLVEAVINRRDLEAYFQTSAFPRYANLVPMYEKPGFDLLTDVGYQQQNQGDHGGRANLGPFPDWVARNLSNQTRNEYEQILANDTIMGLWPFHVREDPDDHTFPGVGKMRFPSINDHPNGWLDARAVGDGVVASGGPLQIYPYCYCPIDPNGPYSQKQFDNAHATVSGYPSYVLTGTRFYADEMAYRANATLLYTFQDEYYNSRGGGKDDNGVPIHDGSWGLLTPNETRGIGWGIRDLGLAGMYSPENDLQAYFSEKLQHTLDFLDEIPQSDDPLTALQGFSDYQNVEGKRTLRVRKTWMDDYVAWAIDFVNKLGYSGGLKMRDAIARFTLETFKRSLGSSYYIAVGDYKDGDSFEYYGSFDRLQQRNVDEGLLPDLGGGYSQTNGRLMLLIADEQGWDGVEGAYRAFATAAQYPWDSACNWTWLLNGSTDHGAFAFASRFDPESCDGGSDDDGGSPAPDR